MDNQLGFTTQDAIELLKNLPKSPLEFLTEEDKENYQKWVDENRKKQRKAMENSSHLVLG